MQKARGAIFTKCHYTMTTMNAVRTMNRETAELARQMAAADNAAAARACLQRLEREVVEAREAARVALEDVATMRSALSVLQSRAEIAAARTREPFAQLVFSSLAALALSARSLRSR